MERIRWRAASQLARFPVMTIVSELLFSAGRSILVLHSSRIYGECLKKKVERTSIVYFLNSKLNDAFFAVKVTHQSYQ